MFSLLIYPVASTVTISGVMVDNGGNSFIFIYCFGRNLGDFLIRGLNRGRERVPVLNGFTVVNFYELSYNHSHD